MRTVNYKSKRFWLNVITTGVSIAMLVTASNDIVPVEYHKFILFGVAGANIILQRFFNTEGGTNIMKK